MPFASDKLYDVYLRRNMPTIVSRVKVREIMPHLSCLTSHDRENIEAKRETSGNYDGMVLLLDCLKRRENWPEQFIQALEACEHTTLAAEIRKEYESLQNIQHPSADSAPKTVVRAHVHPAPAASKLPISESSGTGQAAAAQPAEALPPPVQTPAQQQVPQVAAVQASQTVSPPEPPQSVLQDEVPPLPSTPPPSPEIQHPQVSDVRPLLGRNAPHQEPEENSESDIRDASGDASSVPLETSLGEEEAVVDVVTSPQQQPLVPHSETATLLAPDPLQTDVTTNDKQLQQPSLTPINSDESSLFTLTPEKHPVQDTTPPVHQVPTAALHPEESPEQAAEQSVKSKPQADAAVGTSPEPRVERRNSVNEDDVENTMCLSKPTQLLSVYPENTPSPSAEASNALEQPYSGNSGRLEISEAASDAACTAVGANLGNAVSVQENGIAPDLSQPEENHYESPNQSFEVRENVVHLTEMPSIPNLDTPVQQPQIVNGEPAKGGFSSTATLKAADDSEASLRSHHSESYTPAGAGASDRVSEQKSVPNPTPDHANRNYLIGAAAVGVAALALFLMKPKN